MASAEGPEAGQGEKELPLASGIPLLKEETHIIELAWKGERHRVEIRPVSWGRIKALQRGTKVRVRVVEEEDPDTHEVRDVRVEERDAEEILTNAERIFPVMVVAVNGVPWSGRRIEELDPGFTQAVMEALAPYLSETMGAARKKSPGR